MKTRGLDKKGRSCEIKNENIIRKKNIRKTSNVYKVREQESKCREKEREKNKKNRKKPKKKKMKEKQMFSFQGKKRLKERKKSRKGIESRKKLNRR